MQLEIINQYEIKLHEQILKLCHSMELSLHDNILGSKGLLALATNHLGQSRKKGKEKK